MSQGQDIQYAPPKGEIRSPHEHPDWQAIERALGEPPHERDTQQMGEALCRILLWATRGSDNPGPNTLPTIGKRVLRLAWEVDPSLLEGSPTMLKLARTLFRRVR